MSFGRWLLTHSLSLFLAAMLLAAWFWRDELELDRAWAQLHQVGSQMQLAEAEQEPAVAETDAGSVKASQPATPASGQREAREASAQPTPAGTAATPREMPATGNIDTHPPDPVSAIDPLLAEARRAFWSRQFDRAIATYRALIEQQPQNPDYLGELGNIYYNLNRFDRAAELFERAGLLLVEQGDLERARQLLPALSSLDRDRGQRLRQAIEPARSAGADSQS